MLDESLYNDPMTNDNNIDYYEARMREAKANKLADAVIAAYRYDCDGTDSEVLEAITANEFTEDWDWFAEMAGVKAPSETTIDLTYAIIRRRLSATVLDDPFDGING